MNLTTDQTSTLGNMIMWKLNNKHPCGILSIFSKCHIVFDFVMYHDLNV